MKMVFYVSLVVMIGFVSFSSNVYAGDTKEDICNNWCKDWRGPNGASCSCYCTLPNGATCSDDVLGRPCTCYCKTKKFNYCSAPKKRKIYSESVFLKKQKLFCSSLLASQANHQTRGSFKTSPK